MIARDSDGVELEGCTSERLLASSYAASDTRCALRDDRTGLDSGRTTTGEENHAEREEFCRGFVAQHIRCIGSRDTNR